MEPLRSGGKTGISREWQGVMRNEIIAQRLVDLTEADKQNTDIQYKVMVFASLWAP